MHALRYVSASGLVVEMDGPSTWAGTALDMRANKWDYELGARRLKRALRKAWTPEVEVYFGNSKDADVAAAIFDADVGAGIPGMFYANGCHQPGYCLGLVPLNLTRRGLKAKLQIALLDGVWRIPETYHLFPQSGDINGTKVYPLRYPYTYGSSLGVRYLNIGDMLPIAWKMVIYGYAVTPQLTIGGNVYQFDVTVPDGGYLEVDTSPADPTVRLVTADGASMDAFDCAQRGSGPGCGAYAFERISPGRKPVYWNDSFGTDLTVYHETGCPPNACD